MINRSVNQLIEASTESFDINQRGLGGDFTSLEKCQILTNNPHRLRGDYQTVFREFTNVNYVAPFRTVIKIDDDDVPF